jgi:hypothetical protein
MAVLSSQGMPCPGYKEIPFSITRSFLVRSIPLPKYSVLGAKNPFVNSVKNFSRKRRFLAVCVELKKSKAL